MKKLKRLSVSIIVSFLVALCVGLGVNTFQGYDVKRGFAFGPPQDQQTTSYRGWYGIKRWGFPATYLEVHSFQPGEGASGNFYYTAKPLSPLLVVTNVVLLMSFIVAMLSPITIFWRPKKASSVIEMDKNESNLPGGKPAPQLEKDANTWH
ncbi:hypothetical protein JNM87_03330 [Candidatus Saccharibacteria bacterium]|nr:hypothetical protein [Candidatus Saccharibacteria bacterium]